MVRLYFLGDLDKQKQSNLIKRYLNELNTIKNDFKELKNELKKNKIPKEYIEKAKFQFATLDFGLEYYKFTYKWFSELLKNIENEY